MKQLQNVKEKMLKHISQIGKDFAGTANDLAAISRRSKSRLDELKKELKEILDTALSEAPGESRTEHEMRMRLANSGRGVVFCRTKLEVWENKEKASTRTFFGRNKREAFFEACRAFGVVPSKLPEPDLSSPYPIADYSCANCGAPGKRTIKEAVHLGLETWYHVCGKCGCTSTVRININAS